MILNDNLKLYREGECKAIIENKTTVTYRQEKTTRKAQKMLLENYANQKVYLFIAQTASTSTPMGHKSLREPSAVRPAHGSRSPPVSARAAQPKAGVEEYGQRGH